MDCQELERNIEKLKSLRVIFSGKLNDSTQTGQGKAGLSSISSEIIANTDEILGRYLFDFAEHNPDVFSLKLRKRFDLFGNRLEPANVTSISALPDGGFLLYIPQSGGILHIDKDEDGKLISGDMIDLDIIATSVDASSNGDILVGGTFGQLRHYVRDEDGEFVVGQEIPGFSDQNIGVISFLSDGSAVVSDESGLYHATKDADGGFKLKKIGDKFSCRGMISRVSAISSLPDGSFLVGGWHGALYHATKNKDGEFELGKEITGHDDDIYTIAVLPDGSALIGGELGYLSHMVVNEDGEYIIGEPIKGFRSDKVLPDITSISVLPDGNALIGDDNGGLYCVNRDEDGSYEPAEKIAEIKRVGDSIDLQHPVVTCTNSDGATLIGGPLGALYYATKAPLTVDGLKQNLDKMAKK